MLTSMTDIDTRSLLVSRHCNRSSAVRPGSKLRAAIARQDHPDLLTAIHGGLEVVCSRAWRAFSQTWSTGRGPLSSLVVRVHRDHGPR